MFISKIKEDLTSKNQCFECFIGNFLLSEGLSGRVLAFALAVKTPLEAKEMSTGTHKFGRLCWLLLKDSCCRSVKQKASLVVVDTYVCSAAFEVSIGGQPSRVAVLRGRVG